MSAPHLHAVTFHDWTKYRLVVEADSAAHAIELAQQQLNTGEIWNNATPCDGTQDDWYAYPLPVDTHDGGAQ